MLEPAPDGQTNSCRPWTLKGPGSPPQSKTAKRSKKRFAKTERLSRDRRVFLPGVRDVLPEVRELRHCTKSRLSNKQTRARGGRRRARRIRRPHYLHTTPPSSRTASSRPAAGFLVGRTRRPPSRPAAANSSTYLRVSYLILSPAEVAGRPKKFFAHWRPGS
jgi:hypothetical protein